MDTISSTATRTNGEAVGPSRIANSSSVKGSRGTKYVRTGTKSMITRGKPIAAIRIALARVSRMAGVGQHTYGLCDRHGGTEADELDSDEHQDPRLAHPPQRLVGRGQGFIAQEVEELACDAVSLQSICTHIPARGASVSGRRESAYGVMHSQEPGQDTSRDQVEDVQERTGQEDEA